MREEDSLNIPFMRANCLKEIWQIFFSILVHFGIKFIRTRFVASAVLIKLFYTNFIICSYTCNIACHSPLYNPFTVKCIADFLFLTFGLVFLIDLIYWLIYWQKPLFMHRVLPNFTLLYLNHKWIYKLQIQQFIAALH